MDSYCITVFNRIGPGLERVPGFDVEFYFTDWEKMGERLDWLMNIDRPFLAANKEAFLWFVSEAIANGYTFIVPDYFTGKHSPQRFTIEKKAEHNGKD